MSDDEIIFIDSPTQIDKKNINKIEDDKDNDIIELFELKPSFDPNKQVDYYKNDCQVNKQDVLKRWNKKKLSDPKTNLTTGHYRQISFGEPFITSSYFKYKPGIFLDLDENNSTNVTLSKVMDKHVLDKKIQKIILEKEITKKQLENTCQYIVNNLKEIYSNNIFEIKQKFHKDRFNFNKKRCKLNQIHYSDLNIIEFNYNQELNKIETDSNEKIKALESLFESGAYQPGKLNEYETMEVYQPKAKRRKYYDDGHRQVILPEKFITNILIEDEIYRYYYGNPE